MAIRLPDGEIEVDSKLTVSASPTMTDNVIIDFTDASKGPFASVFQVLRSGLGSIYGLLEVFCNRDDDCGLQIYGNSVHQSANLLELYPDKQTLTTFVNGSGDLHVGTALVAEVGVTPKLGLFGVDPAPQQQGGAATAGDTYTATEKAMVQKCYDALRIFGHLT